MMKSLKSPLIIFLVIFGLLYCSGMINRIVEGFDNPFQEIIKKIQAAQNQSQAYDQWLGYVYKHAPENSDILNDFKERVFQPSCRFRKDWATVTPKGMNIPIGATTKEFANIAYKNYMGCLQKGTRSCLNQLENARKRLMEPGCQFLHTKSYSQNFRVSMH